MDNPSRGRVCSPEVTVWMVPTLAFRTLFSTATCEGGEVGTDGGEGV